MVVQLMTIVMQECGSEEFAFGEGCAGAKEVPVGISGIEEI